MTFRLLSVADMGQRAEDKAMKRPSGVKRRPHFPLVQPSPGKRSFLANNIVPLQSVTA